MRREKPVAVIASVAPHSLAFRLGLQPGDRIVKINGKRIPDLITYQLAEAQEHLVLEVEKENGEYWEYEVEKAETEGLGLSFKAAVFDGIKRCRNHCLFCFVDQMPPKLRPSLYIKDDDYRLSFLQGSYITLTNLTDADWQRIQRFRLSPLYIAVHATDPEVRVRLLGGNKGAGEIQAHLNVYGRDVIFTPKRCCPGSTTAQFWKNHRRSGRSPHLQTLCCSGGLDRTPTVLALAPFKQEEAQAVLVSTPRSSNFLTPTEAGWSLRPMSFTSKRIRSFLRLRNTKICCNWKTGSVCGRYLKPNFNKP